MFLSKPETAPAL